MNIVIGLGAILLGVALSLWPTASRKLATFFDTLVHEAGHGLASLPFGAPLPSITVRSNTSGETQSSMGYLHQLLPFGIGRLTEKIARTLSLMAGYSASILFAAVLLVIAGRSEVTFEPWQLLFLAQVILATVLWTLVRITDSPWTFVVVALIATGIYLLLLPWDWRIYVGSLVGLVVLFFLARTWLASLAVLLTMSAPLVPLLGLIFGENDPLEAIFEPIDLTVDTLWLSRIIFGALLVFLAFCCRSALSLGLTVLILGGVLGLLFVPGLPSAYVLLGVTGMLAVAGGRSLLQLHALTFQERGGHWQQERPDTDMVFASEEIGGDPRGWYWTQVAVAGLGAGAILLWGYFL